MSTQTFYAQEAANRRNSIILAGVVALVLGALVCGIAVLWGAEQTFALEAGAGAILAGLGAGLLSYRFGDRLVLSSAQAHEVTATEEPQLVHVVAELALAAGIPTPRVYLIEDAALNAFATGRDPAHASVAITRGLLERLDREELQGVLGHELSHVRNYDIRYTLIIGVLVGTIVLVADIFLRVTLRSGFRGRKGGGFIVILLLTLVLAAVATVVAKLIELAASRQREYLADASSVELTRNPRGLERALTVLASDATPLHAVNRATQHLFIVNPLERHGGLSIFSTHPPLGNRIDRLRRLSGDAPLSAEEDKILDRSN